MESPADPDTADSSYTAAGSGIVVVPEGVARERADKVLAQALPGLSRVAVQRAFDDDRVVVDGKPIPKGRRVSAGEVLRYSLPEVRPSEVVARDIPLQVLYEDASLIVVNKPPGMVVHPGAGTGEDTLVHALLAQCRGQLSGIGGVERPGIVHRLDRDTSGVIIAAKTDPAHRALAAAFATRAAQKEYLALATGVPGLLSGTIRGAIARDPSRRHRMAVVADESGRDARTDWQREEAFGAVAALLRCFIHTGRTHQIRVHLKSIGHPIIGDRIYGWRADTRLPFQPPRILLHAARLVVPHPVSGEALDCAAPLPEDFVSAMRVIRSLAG